jgi:hypothetical protein
MAIADQQDDAEKATSQLFLRAWGGLCERVAFFKVPVIDDAQEFLSHVVSMHPDGRVEAVLAIISDGVPRRLQEFYTYPVRFGFLGKVSPTSTVRAANKFAVLTSSARGGLVRAEHAESSTAPPARLESGPYRIGDERGGGTPRRR